MHSAFIEYFDSTLGCDTVEVAPAWRNNQSCHVESTRTDKEFTAVVGKIAVGTMLCTRYHDREQGVAVAPCHDVHHRFGVASVHRESRIEHAEESFAHLRMRAADNKRRHYIARNQCQILFIIFLYKHIKAATESRPVGLQWQDATCSGLEMLMVGSRRTTLWTIIEHHKFGIQTQKLVYFAIVSTHFLLSVTAHRNGEVRRKNRIRIDKKREIAVNVLRHLLLRTVAFTEEAWPFGKRCLVDLRSRRYHPCGIELHFEHSVVA